MIIMKYEATSAFTKMELEFQFALVMCGNHQRGNAVIRFLLIQLNNRDIQ